VLLYFPSKGSIVAAFAALIPSLLITFKIVFKNILTSKVNEI
jgi:hypothetical protein